MYMVNEDMNALVALEASNDFALSFSIPGMPTETNFLLVNGVTYGKAERGGTLISLRPWMVTCMYGNEGNGRTCVLATSALQWILKMRLV